MTKAYPWTQLKRVKILLVGMRDLCLRGWKKRVTHGIFKFLEDKYGGFKRTWELLLLGGGWSTGRRKESLRVGRGKFSNLELDLIALPYTLPRIQISFYWEQEEGLAPIFWIWPEGYH